MNKEINKFMCYRERKNLGNQKLKFKYTGALLKPKSKQIPILNYQSKQLFTVSDKCNALANTFETIFNTNVYETIDISLNENVITL